MANFKIDSDDPAAIAVAFGRWLYEECHAHDGSLKCKMTLRAPNPQKAAAAKARFEKALAAQKGGGT